MPDLDVVVAILCLPVRDLLLKKLDLAKWFRFWLWLHLWLRLSLRKNVFLVWLRRAWLGLWSRRLFGRLLRGRPVARYCLGLRRGLGLRGRSSLHDWSVSLRHVAQYRILDVRIKIGRQYPFHGLLPDSIHDDLSHRDCRFPDVLICAREGGVHESHHCIDCEAVRVVALVLLVLRDAESGKQLVQKIQPREYWLPLTLPFDWLHQGLREHPAVAHFWKV
mmetsp:Transcript_7711/g.22003  ORF Transcript_7711/g.22003 Transcript_7711/m.22003 type:complete len:220 (+) Transcript_7711:1835-2494(+)